MSEILARKVELVPVESIEPHPANPNEGDVGQISESIDAVGFYSVVFVQESSRRILAGEHRWRAAAASGMSRVPVVLLDVDDETALRIMLADNEIPRQHSRPDEHALAALLTDLVQQTDSELAGTGWSNDLLDALIADLAQPNGFAPDDEAQPRLDERTPKPPMVCPNCGHEWNLRLTLSE